MTEQQHMITPPPELVEQWIDEPAVPQDREPASVTGRPSDEELLDLLPQGIESGFWLPKSLPSDWVDGEFIAPPKAIIAFARAVLARWGRPAPAPPADVSQLSDGYHTFAELYEHRHSLMLALMRALPRICWFSRRHADGELPFGSDDWFIVGAELPGAPITYHLPAALYSLAQKTGALELPAGRPWDGHSAADVVHRLRDWAIEPTPPADGEVAELAEWLREQLHVCLQAPWTPGIKHFGRAAELIERLSTTQKELERERLRLAVCGVVAMADTPETAAKARDCLPEYWSASADDIARQIDKLMRLSPPQPVPVAERLPGPEDMTDDGEVWIEDPGHEYPLADAGDYDWEPHKWILRPIGKFDAQNGLRWLPTHTLPLPGVNNG